MNNFIFENKNESIFRERMCQRISAGNRCDAWGQGSACLWRRFDQENGVYEEITAALEKAGKTIIEFPGIMENPTYKKVLEGTKLVKEKQVDWILAVGGGSVMDCSKAISMAAVSEKDVWDEYWAKKGNCGF